MEAYPGGGQRVATHEPSYRRIPDCGKPLDLYHARSLMTLFARRLFLRCQGWPRCEFYARYKPPRVQ